MSEMLRRTQAPISDAAWAEIDETAASVLRTHLSARKIVDFRGPEGWSLGAVSLGRLEIAGSPGPEEVPWGIRKVQPLIETRIPVRLEQIELDYLARGAKDADLGPLEEAAVRAALFEDSAIYRGFEPASATGIMSDSTHSPVSLPDSPEDYPRAVSEAVSVMTAAGIEGPFALVLGSEAWFRLAQAGASGYPPWKIITELTQGEILMSRAIEGGLLLSAAGGHFELTVGGDFSIGFATADKEHVELYLTESFAFRTLEPKAAVRLTAK